ncbi:MAG: leucine-rich repeat domain-containing protein [Bifidobacteriaceae bacterium]|jgi:internalin A|nr:leucine-rich repeat domain-containing protein [Bifidobacteriaceae bacterium]
MRSSRRVAIGLLFSLVLGGGVAAPAQADDLSDVVPDMQFRACLNQSMLLNQTATAPISADQIATITGFNPVGKVDCGGYYNIASIEGAQYFDDDKVTAFRLYKHNVTDLSPLAGLTKLTNLDIEVGPLADLSPLAGLVNLEWLYLQDNLITDLTPLAGLSSLQYLQLGNDELGDVYGNHVTDLSPLASLTTLLNLGVQNTDTAWNKDPGGTKVNAVSDLSPLTNLVNLTNLNIGRNLVTDLTPLAGMLNMTGLYMRYNQITDLSPLEGMTKLVTISAEYNQIATGLDKLAGAVDMNLMDLTSNKLTSLVGIEGMTKLPQLRVANNQIEDLSPAQNLTQLTGVYTQYNKVKDLSPLAGLTNVTIMSVGGNPASDLSPLAGLTALKTLAAYEMPVSDVTPLANLVNLTTLYLDGDQIADASSLTKDVLTKLNDGSALTLDGQHAETTITAEIGDILPTYTVESLGLKSRNGKAVALSEDAPAEGQTCSAATVAEVTVPNVKGEHKFYFCSEDTYFRGTYTVNIERPAIEGTKPVISGEVEVDQTLTAETGTWTPAPVDLAYQWLRGGTPIDGATSATYKVTAADVGAELSVKVTGSKAERDSLTLTSDPTCKVPKVDTGGGTTPTTPAKPTPTPTKPTPTPTPTKPTTPTTPTTPAKPSGYTPTYSWFSLSPDLTSDGDGEILAVKAATGELWLFDGKDGSGYELDAGTVVATGVAKNRAYGPGDWDNDGFADVVTVDPSGLMWLRKGDGKGGLGAPVEIGHGWAPFRIIPAGDLNRDGANDLLAIDKGGLLWLYAGNGHGGFKYKYPTQVGRGWVGLELYAAGDLNNDGCCDILTILPDGTLWAYNGRGNGTFEVAHQVGRGWTTFHLAAGADLNGENWADIVGRNDQDGSLFYYQGNGGGSFQVAKQIGSNW